MFVTSMLLDWGDTRKVRPVKWTDVEAAIRRLDGKSRTEVSIGNDVEAHMSVTGGPGCYLVSATPNNDVFYDLLNPKGNPNRVVKVVSGGQLVSVRQSEAVDLKAALHVARLFAENGTIDPDSTWLRNPPDA